MLMCLQLYTTSFQERIFCSLVQLEFFTGVQLPKFTIGYKEQCILYKVLNIFVFFYFPPNSALFSAVKKRNDYRHKWSGNRCTTIGTIGAATDVQLPAQVERQKMHNYRHKWSGKRSTTIGTSGAIILGWLDSSIRRRKRAFYDVIASQKMAVLQCWVWLLAKMRSSRAAFDLYYRKFRVNRHLRLCQFQKKLGSVPCWVRIIHYTMAPHTAHFKVKIRTHTRHISEFFGNWQNLMCLFTPDLLLFKSNKARDELISANSQTQHWRTAIFWLAVTSSNDLFLRRIEESIQPSIIL